MSTRILAATGIVVVLTAAMAACGVDVTGSDGNAGGSPNGVGSHAPSTEPPIEENAPGGPAGGGTGTPPADPPAAPANPILDLFPPARLAEIRAALPTVADPGVNAILKSAATIWYDRTTIIPGYQDSFGDNVIAPIGFRPNTIDPGMINLAVPGGHQKLFVKKGFFHFPFGVTGAPDDAPNAFVVDFWSPPIDPQTGKPLPVVWWRRDPNQNTHKYVWSFPKGTVFGEALFITAPSGVSYVYEIRTRTRELGQWRVDAFRPFPRASDLAAALAASPWQTSPTATQLSAHLNSNSTLVAATLDSKNRFVGAFAAQPGAKDSLPPIDPTLVIDLLTTTFRSARGIAWKTETSASGPVTLQTWAPTTDEGFSIVPKNYKGGFLEVSEVSCGRCHQDAGRPFKDWHSEVLAYGELWGEDEIFSWHPFDTSKFVDPATGAVKNFNYDNRAFRADFVTAGLLEKYDPSKHSKTTYAEIPRAWRSFQY